MMRVQRSATCSHSSGRASYTHAAAHWRGPSPRFDAAALPLVLLLLRVRRSRSPLPATASPRATTPPAFSPSRRFAAVCRSRGRRTTRGLRPDDRAPNLSSAGWTADQGLATSSRVGDVAPDLVIVAFGMNDSGYASPGRFLRRYRRHHSRLRRQRPMRIDPRIADAAPSGVALSGARPALANTDGAGGSVRARGGARRRHLGLDGAAGPEERLRSDR